MPNPLDIYLAGRTGALDEAPAGNPYAYNPLLDLASLTSYGASPLARNIGRQQMGLQAIGQRMRESQAASRVDPALSAINPSAPDFSDQINKLIFTPGNEEALFSPRVNKILAFKESLAHHPEMTATDITDPELLQRWQEREAQGIDWRTNHQQYVMDADAKKKRLDLLNTGMHPDMLRQIMDPEGRISDEDYNTHKYALTANQKQPLPTKEFDELLKAHSEAMMEPSIPTPDAKKAWLESVYPGKKTFTVQDWQDAHNALSQGSKRNMMKLRLSSLLNEGKVVPPQLLSAYGVQPIVTRFDPKSKRLIQGMPDTVNSETPSPIPVTTQADYEAIPKGTVFSWNGRTAIKQ